MAWYWVLEVVSLAPQRAPHYVLLSGLGSSSPNQYQGEIHLSLSGSSAEIRSRWHWTGRQGLNSSRFTSRAELARQLGITRAHVTQVLSLLHLAPDVKSLILSRGDPIGEKGLGIRTLRSLLHLPVDKQINWIKEYRTGGLERQDC